MFAGNAGCENLQGVDLSGLEFENVESAESLAQSCKSATNITLVNQDLKKLKTPANVFERFSNAIAIDLSGF